jgi:hypothetical protein
MRNAKAPAITPFIRFEIAMIGIMMFIIIPLFYFNSYVIIDWHYIRVRGIFYLTQLASLEAVRICIRVFRNDH